MKILRFFCTLLKKGDKKTFFQKWKKSFLFPLFQKCIKKSKYQQKQIWNLVFSFMYLVSVYPMDRTQLYWTLIEKGQVEIMVEIGREVCTLSSLIWTKYQIAFQVHSLLRHMQLHVIVLRTDNFDSRTALSLTYVSSSW